MTQKRVIRAKCDGRTEDDGTQTITITIAGFHTQEEATQIGQMIGDFIKSAMKDIYGGEHREYVREGKLVN